MINKIGKIYMQLFTDKSEYNFYQSNRYISF
jgi:hypothetical protein